jgi:CPA1 family monovalent cation:H+ antiporter
MELTHHEELQLFALLAVGTALLVLVPVLRVPYPILLVLGGLAMGVMPGLPDVELPPDLVLVAFLPPLLYGAAFYTSLREFRANARQIGGLAVGLVVATTAGIAVVAHEAVTGLTWQEAFVLGAIVSPTDPIAATAIAQRLGVSRRIVVILEGESLVNDATALVLYRAAVAAAVGGAFSLWDTGLKIVVGAVGGIAIGLAVGFVVRAIRARIDHPQAEIGLSLLTGYLAFLPAEVLGVSAVLAAVTAGIYVGWYAPVLTTPALRLQGAAFWDVLTFVLNSVLFALVGLELPHVVEAIGDEPPGEVATAAIAVSAGVILIRVVWVYAFMFGPYVRGWIGGRAPGSKWRYVAVVSWAGMRGAVSLAAALAIPLDVPQRDLLIFLAFVVILVTLVGQGLTLPALIRLLDLPDDASVEREDAKARIFAADAAVARLDELEREDWVREDTAERMRGLYSFRRNRFEGRLDGSRVDVEEQSQDYQRLRRELLQAEELAVIDLRTRGVIADDVMHRVLRDIALEVQRLDTEG